MLNGTESVALSGAKIKDYRWSLERGDSSVKIEVQVLQHGGGGFCVTGRIHLETDG